MIELTPTRKTRLIALATIVICLIFFSWVFFLNRGKIEITGATPFTVNISGGVEEQTCISLPCQFSLPPRDYQVSIKKGNHYPVAYSVPVKLWKTTPVPVEFRLIPLLKSLTNPEQYLTESPFSSNFNSISTLTPTFNEKLLSRLKRSVVPIKQVFFSPSGQQFLNITEKTIELYQTDQTGSRQKLSLPTELTYAWDHQEKNVFYLTSPAAQKRQALQRFSLADQTTEDLAYFLSPIQKSRLFPSPDDQFLAVANVSEKPALLYWLNLPDASRELLFQTEIIHAVEISPDNQHLVYWGKTAQKDPDLPAYGHRFVFYYGHLSFPSSLSFQTERSSDLESTTTALPTNPRTLFIITNPELAFWTPDQTLVFATYQKYQLEKTSQLLGPQKIILDRELTDQLKIIEYHPTTDEYFILLEPSPEIIPLKLTWETTKNSAYLLSEKPAPEKPEPEKSSKVRREESIPSPETGPIYEVVME